MEALNKKVIEKSLPKVDLLSFYYCKLIKTKKNILKRPPYLKKKSKTYQGIFKPQVFNNHS